MAVKLYSLQALAEIMGVSYSKVRHVIYTLNKEGKPLEWEGYRFIKQGDAKHYFAVEIDTEVEFVDKVKGAGEDR